jgi:Xaa-Pro aminopeptidase
MKFTSDFFSQNRKNFFEKMESNSVLILTSNNKFPKNGDQQFPFRQQSDLFYLTGITQEETCLILFKDKDSRCYELLFILKTNKKLEIWEGKKLNKEEAQSISGIKKISINDNFDTELKKIISNNTQFYILGNEAYNQDVIFNTKHEELKNKIKEFYPKNKIVSARPILNILRLIKSEEEIRMIQKAVDITNLAFIKVLKTIKPEQYEYVIESEISYVFRTNGCNGHAYNPIIATGINACGLHYDKNNAEVKDGDMLLMDFGADCNYYAADLSRTIPVNGKFTKRQKELYQIVLDVQKRSIELYVPGNTIDIVNKKTKAWMKEALDNIGLLKSEKDIDRYFPHGTSHFLGIDVHDVGTKSIKFKKGMLLTCEPGLYIEEENIGIRIENDILVEEKPIDLMKNTIREVKDIETAMSL